MHIKIEFKFETKLETTNKPTCYSYKYLLSLKLATT